MSDWLHNLPVPLMALAEPLLQIMPGEPTSR
jgi:hypothetical protein